MPLHRANCFRPWKFRESRRRPKSKRHKCRAPSAGSTSNGVHSFFRLLVLGEPRPGGLCPSASALDHGQLYSALGGLFGARGGFEELDEVLEGFGQDFSSFSDFVLAFSHAFIAREKQGLGFSVLASAQKRLS